MPARRRRRRPATAVWIALAAVVALAALLAVTLSGEDEDEPLATAAVEVEGAPLPELPEGPDPAVGAAAPTLRGTGANAAPLEVAPGSRPTILLFVAHWCPVCQEEVPKVAEWVDEGGLPDGVDLVTVSTGVSPDRPNYPPLEWLEREGWTSPVLLDDDSGGAADAYGLPGYPYFVFLDADGTLAGRHAGALPVDALDAAAEALASRAG